MKFHVNPETGEAGACKAIKGGCPFGGEEKHFTSIEAARANYESTQQSFSMPLKEMNAQAKSTDDPALISRLIDNGSERTFANLAKNPNLTNEQAGAMLAKLKNPVIRAALYTRSDLVLKFDGITPEDFEEIMFRTDPRDSNPLSYPSNGQLPRMTRDPFLTDAHYDRVMNSPRIRNNIRKNLPAVLSEPNGISPKKLREWLDSNNWPRWPASPDVALVSGKLTEQDLIDAPEHYISHFSATGPSPRLTSKEVDMLARVGVKRGDERLTLMAARDDRISQETLEELVNRGYHSEELYKNSKLSAAAKKKIEDARPDEPFVRMGKLKERIGVEAFETISRNDGGSNLGRAYNESRILFDTAKVKEYELTRDDIFYLANARGFNAGVSYDSATGLFTGRVDSSG